MPERRFRKRPVEVAALQWTGGNEQELAEFTRGQFMAVDEEDRANSDDPENTGAVLDSLHSSWIGMATGDWVVRGPRGEFYAIKDGVLAETYEPADAEAGDAQETEADPDAETLRRAAQWLRDDAYSAERKDRSVRLGWVEARALAEWLEFEAGCLDEGGSAASDPAGEHALNFALPYLGEEPAGAGGR